MPTQSEGQVLRTVPLSKITVCEGFNPREGAERAEIDRLTDSVREHGLIQPLVVREADGGYELVDGERRYRACAQAAVTEVPVIVRETDADTDGLDVALVANMSRVDLDPVEEARAMRRLIESGLTRKGVAERLSIPQARVRERLQLLELPQELWPRIADGSIPLAVAKALDELAKIHPQLPARAVAEVLEGQQSEDPYGEQWTWRDVSQNALEVAVADEDELPAGIYLTHRSYPLESFTLSDKAQQDLRKFAKLRGVDVEEISTLRFEGREVEAARALGAVHDVGRGTGTLIAGQDVADQLACDAIAAALKDERARQRDAKRTAEHNDGANSGSPGETAAPVDEDVAKELRRKEREMAEQERREAVAHNLELGAQVAKQLAKVKLDERVLRILSAFKLSSELDKVALRGARYGFPGWVSEETRKNGSVKHVYLDRGEAHAKARGFLANATGAGEVAGRQIALLAMARYAEETAVAQSARAFYELAPGRDLPWSDEAVELLDDLVAEKLPAHVLERGREQREQEAARRQRARENEAWYAQAVERLEASSPAERAELLTEAKDRFESYDPRTWQLRQRIEQLDTAKSTAKPSHSETADGEEGGESA